MSSKMTDLENDARQKEEKIKTLESQITDWEKEWSQTKLAAADVEQNKHNLEYEIVELTTQNKELKSTNEGNTAVIEQLKEQLSSTPITLGISAAKVEDLENLRSNDDTKRRTAAVGVLENIRTVEDIESVTASGYSLLDVCGRLQGGQRTGLIPSWWRTTQPWCGDWPWGSPTPALT